MNHSPLAARLGAHTWVDLCALQDNVAAAADNAKDKMTSKGEKNKAEAQTSTYNTRSKAAAALNPDK